MDKGLEVAWTGMMPSLLQRESSLGPIHILTQRALSVARVDDIPIRMIYPLPMQLAVELMFATLHHSHSHKDLDGLARKGPGM